ncbi:hypothetical protein ScalyP_jg12113 [Parmales sp. scaly parma]|jgi:hypothetical protein|nr:hypothetical protein ScalyP_jg12113 [Parmales sp. scaly parma]
MFNLVLGALLLLRLSTTCAFQLSKTSHHINFRVKPSFFPLHSSNNYEPVVNSTGFITDNIPGKIVLTPDEIQAQKAALLLVEKDFVSQRDVAFVEKEALVGWTKQAEMYNGRFAMFFVVVGLLTELWTGVTFPGQIEEMLRVTGVIEMN